MSLPAQRTEFRVSKAYKRYSIHVCFIKNVAFEVLLVTLTKTNNEKLPLEAKTHARVHAAELERSFADAIRNCSYRRTLEINSNLAVQVNEFLNSNVIT